MRELCEKFLSPIDGYRSPNLKDPDRYRREARSILSVRVAGRSSEDRPAASVRNDEIDGMRNTLGDWIIAVDVDEATGSETARKLSPRSAAMAMARLSKVYNWGRRAELIDCTNPVAGCERPVYFIVDRRLRAG